jgi:hypothetical protein
LLRFLACSMPAASEADHHRHHRRLRSILSGRPML